MAINIDTQDLDNYPGNVKRVTVDQESLIPTGFEGDEQILLNISTTAYSDITARTAIQDLYVSDFKTGWCKSSGFMGTKFALDASNRSLEVKIDSTTSGISDGYYRVTLAHSSGLPVDAEVIAADLEVKIRAIADLLDTADEGYRLAYLNASVEFRLGRFWIVSGSIGKYYSGSTKSSVQVRASSVTDCTDLLGFDLNTTSEDIDGVTVKEALVLTDYVAAVSGTGSITISSTIGAATNDCMLITDRTNSDYFQIDSVTDGTAITFDAAKVASSYTADVTKVQLLREQDPSADPTLWFDSIDKISRHGLKTIINQIDYSS